MNRNQPRKVEKARQRFYMFVKFYLQENFISLWCLRLVFVANSRRSPPFGYTNVSASGQYFEQ